MRRGKWVLIGGGAIIVLLLGYRLLAPKSAAADRAQAAFNPVRAARGSIAIIVEASGKVAPATTIDLSPARAGKVTSLPVEIGDSVKSGQILARIDPTDADALLGQAEDALRVATAKLETAKTNAALSPAQARMEVDRAKAAVSSAKSKLDLLRSGPTTQEITQAKSAVSQAQLALDSAKLDFERMQKLYAEQAVTKQQLDAAENKYLTAVEGLKSAQAKLDQTIAPAKDEDLAAAEATLAQAKADLAIAEDHLRTAGQNDQVAAAEAEQRKARDSLATAREEAAGTTVRAPFDGLVMQIAGRVGTYASAQTPLITLAQPEALIVKVEVDETDIAQVRAGQTAVITMDALPNKEFGGKVLSVGGLGQDLNGVVTFTVQLSLTDPEGVAKPGMSADASITIDGRDNVITVPNAALETRMGRQAVRIFLPGGKVEFRRVTVGLRNDTNTEIASGLRAGELVAVPAPKEQSNSMGGFGFMGGGGRRGR